METRRYLVLPCRRRDDGGLATLKPPIGNLSGEIRDLHAAGGRYFLIATLPTRIPAFSAVAVRLNPAIRHMAEDLGHEYPDSRVLLIGWGEAFDEIINAPEKYGLTDVTSGCAKREIFGEDPTPCIDPNAHFFYHDSHPSTRVHAIVGKELAAQIRRTLHVVIDSK